MLSTGALLSLPSEESKEGREHSDKARHTLKLALFVVAVAAVGCGRVHFPWRP